MIQQMLGIWSLVPLPFWIQLKPLEVHSSHNVDAWLGEFWTLLTSMWDECNFAVVWTFFGIAFLWDWNENWPFPVPWPLLSFQICWHIECSTSFMICNSSTGIPSPPLALFVVMLPKAHLSSHSRMSGSRWVITPSWLCWSWRSFFVLFFCVFLLPLLNIFCFC